MLKKLMLILILLQVSSCVTNFLWGARSYREEITQFLVGSDGRYVVLMGPEHHYVFTDNSGVLREILPIQQSKILTLKTENSFELDKNNNITGSLVLTGPFDLLPAQDAFKLQSLGFLPNRNNQIEIKIDVEGRRYSARYLGNVASQNLSQQYFMKVNYREDNGVVGTVGKAAITPVAVTLDAALLIGKVAIYPFTLPYKKMGIE
jgi:hypothetical protein